MLPWIIFGIQDTFFCELEGINQNSTILNMFNCNMSTYSHPQHSSRKLPNLDLYPFINGDVEYYVDV